MTARMTRAVPALAILVLAALTATTTMAQSYGGNVCAPRDTIVTSLTMQYGEKAVGSGFQGDRQIIEVFASDTRGSWTIIITQTNGIACVVGAGTEWSADTLLPVGIPG